MDELKIIELKESIFKNNDERADLLRQELKEKKTFLLNVMSSPGSGKTTTLVRIINDMKKAYRFGIMEADIDGDCDAHTILEKTGAKAIQLHTGGMCHLDAEMTRQGIENMGVDDVDIAVLENIGNLVCPAEFDTGATKSVTILSVPEGDDKPLKYPLIFSVCDIVIINKMDAISVFDFDLDKCKGYIHDVNPDCPVITYSAKTGEGIEEFEKWLSEATDAWLK